MKIAPGPHYFRLIDSQGKTHLFPYIPQAHPTRSQSAQPPSLLGSVYKALTSKTGLALLSLASFAGGVALTYTQPKLLPAVAGFFQKYAGKSQDWVVQAGRNLYTSTAKLLPKAAVA